MNKKQICRWFLFLCLLAAVRIPGKVQAASIQTGERLGQKEAVCYQYLSEMAAAVAAGEQTSASVNIPLEALGIKESYTAEDLGVDALFNAESSVTSAAESAMRQQLAIDCIALTRSLLSDHPYDLYWFDKSYDTYSADTRGLWISRPSVTKAADDQTVCFDSADLKISMKVSAHYGSYYSADTAKTKAAAAAAERAEAIVSECASLDDAEKLAAYKNAIVELTDYHKSATEDLMYGREDFGDPWQLIYVFDGDPDTKVVCEGYAKAFQYLCDLTAFSDPTIVCHCVTGLLNSSSGSAGEPHMWNVVSVGGRNYLADITNSETGMPGEDGALFLAGAAGSGQADAVGGTAADTYRFEWTYGNYYGESYYPDKAWCTYQYDTEALCTYTPDELALSPRSFRLDHIVRPDLPGQITVSIYGDSTHRIKEDGSNLHTCSQGNLQTWEESILLDVPDGATLREALDLFFAENGYLADYRSAHGSGMISWLYREKDTPIRDLSEGSNGADSRWMCLVNDVYTDVPDDTILHDKDSLVLHFSDAPQADIEAALQRAEERAHAGTGESGNTGPDKPESGGNDSDPDKPGSGGNAPNPANLRDGGNTVNDSVSSGSSAGSQSSKNAAKISAAKKIIVTKLKVITVSRKLIVSWKKTKGADGYQVQYRIKGKKWKYLKRDTTKSKVKSKKLKKGKKYSVRVRAYTKVNGRKVYGKWTKAKTVK